MHGSALRRVCGVRNVDGSINPDIAGIGRRVFGGDFRAYEDLAARLAMAPVSFISRKVVYGLVLSPIAAMKPWSESTIRSVSVPAHFAIVRPTRASIRM